MTTNPHLKTRQPLRPRANRFIARIISAYGVSLPRWKAFTGSCAELFGSLPFPAGWGDPTSLTQWPNPSAAAPGAGVARAGEALLPVLWREYAWVPRFKVRAAAAPRRPSRASQFCFRMLRLSGGSAARFKAGTDRIRF